MDSLFFFQGSGDPVSVFAFDVKAASESQVRKGITVTLYSGCEKHPSCIYNI